MTELSQTHPLAFIGPPDEIQLVKILRLLQNHYDEPPPLITFIVPVYFKYQLATPSSMALSLLHTHLVPTLQPLLPSTVSALRHWDAVDGTTPAHRACAQ